MSYHQPRLHIDLLDIVSASYSIAVISSYLDCSLGKFMCVLIFKNAPLPAISRKDWKKSISRHAFCPLFTAPLCSQSLLFQKDHDDFATLITVRRFKCDKSWEFSPFQAVGERLCDKFDFQVSAVQWTKNHFSDIIDFSKNWLLISKKFFSMK